MSRNAATEGPDPLDVQVGGRVRLRRKMIGVTQEQLAADIGVTFQQVQKYERGANRISASMLIRIARRLNCPAAELLGEDADGQRMADEEQSSVLAEPRMIEMIQAFAALPRGGRERGAVIHMAQYLTPVDQAAPAEA